MTEPPRNAYRVTIEVSTTAGREALLDLVERVAETVFDWQPADRDWDAFVGSEYYHDELLPTVDRDPTEEEP